MSYTVNYYCTYNTADIKQFWHLTVCQW